MKLLLSLSFLLLTAFRISAMPAPGTGHEDDRTMQLYQDSLKNLEQRMFRSKDDSVKYQANRQFIAILARALDTEGSFDFPFDSLKGVARLSSPDKKFRIINWNIPRKDGTFEYFGFVQVHTDKKGYKVFRLNDRSEEIKNTDNAVCTAEKWFGMLYYRIIETKYKKHTYYTLLGWDGNDNTSRKKIIDVVTFAPDGTPKFGDGIFTYEKRFPKRVVFEFAADEVMTLNYNFAAKKLDEKKEITANMIVFSHLAPSHPALEGQYQFYVSDGSYDAFMFKNGKWEYVKDVDVRNQLDPKDKLYKVPRQPGAPD
jgi:hypothetical protein